MKALVSSKNLDSRKLNKKFKLAQKLEALFKMNLRVVDNDTEYNFFPETKIEFSRYISFFTKEEGTLQWLNAELKQGDVMFDIGANVGIYSLYAGKLNRDLKIYAFEPHKPSFNTLISNISTNKLTAQIHPIAIALNDCSDILTFNYKSIVSGSSNGQLGHNTSPKGEFVPDLKEIVPAMKLDDLVEKNIIPYPNIIKIDVDGNETSILKGMLNILSSPNKPRSVQVELDVGKNEEIITLLASVGYKLDYRHHSAKGKRLMQEGATETEVGHNAVFKPV